MGYDQIALLFTLTAGFLMFLLPRKWAIVPLFVVAVLIPLGQVIVIAGLHFPMTRILILFGWIRLCLQRQSPRSKLNTIDKTMLLWVIVAVVTHTLLWQTMDALINRLGFAFDALGIYFLVRHFVHDFGDIDRVLQAFAFISVAVAISMWFEMSTGRNAFAVFGGVPLLTEVRAGRLRAQGAFLHPIMAGTFGAALFPLFVSLYWSSRKHKVLAIVGVAAATIITMASSSSGPTLSYLAGIIGFCMWPLRKRMRAVRWGLVSGLIALNLVMKAPVWALIGRVSVFAGSSGYHRVVLIDEFIKRFGEWWLLGARETESWSYKLFVMHDITNHFIQVAVSGGLLSLILFILLIAFCFRGVGRAREAFESQPAIERLSWAFGVCMFVNVAAFMGISYFDQMVVVWYALLALISRLTSLSEDLVGNENEALEATHRDWRKDRSRAAQVVSQATMHDSVDAKSYPGNAPAPYSCFGKGSDPDGEQGKRHPQALTAPKTKLQLSRYLIRESK
jgi:hypothetical protein